MVHCFLARKIAQVYIPALGSCHKKMSRTHHQFLLEIIRSHQSYLMPTKINSHFLKDSAVCPKSCDVCDIHLSRFHDNTVGPMRFLLSHLNHYMCYVNVLVCAQNISRKQCAVLWYVKSGYFYVYTVSRSTMKSAAWNFLQWSPSYMYKFQSYVCRSRQYKVIDLDNLNEESHAPRVTKRVSTLRTSADDTEVGMQGLKCVFLYCFPHCPCYPANAVQMDRTAWATQAAVNKYSLSNGRKGKRVLYESFVDW